MSQIWRARAVRGDVKPRRIAIVTVRYDLEAVRQTRKCYLFAISLALGMLSMIPTPSSAQNNSTVVMTAPGQITKMLSDWNNNAILVALGPNVSFVNPSGCSATDYYETNPTDAAAALNHSLLLTAYTSHASLALAIQGCSFNGRPHIISVSMPN